MEKTKVYYGTIEGHPLGLSLDLEPVQKSLHDLPYNKDLSKCPSFNNYIQNVYVLRTPTRVKVEKMGEHADGHGVWGHSVEIDDHGKKKWQYIGDNTETPDHVQILNNFYLRLLAEDTCNIELLPPFLHHNKLYGVAGVMDISKWFRTLSATTIPYEFELEAGEPLVYVKFDRPVDLQHVVMPMESDIVEQACLGQKSITPKMGLKRLYDLFTRTNRHKFLLNKIKQHNGIS